MTDLEANHTANSLPSTICPVLTSDADLWKFVHWVPCHAPSASRVENVDSLHEGRVHSTHLLGRRQQSDELSKFIPQHIRDLAKCENLHKGLITWLCTALRIAGPTFSLTSLPLRRLKRMSACKTSSRKYSPSSKHEVENLFVPNYIPHKEDSTSPIRSNAISRAMTRKPQLWTLLQR